MPPVCGLDEVPRACARAFTRQTGLEKGPAMVGTGPPMSPDCPVRYGSVAGVRCAGEPYRCQWLSRLDRGDRVRASRGGMPLSTLPS